MKAKLTICSLGVVLVAGNVAFAQSSSPSKTVVSRKPATAGKPNVVYFLVDNLGMGELSFCHSLMHLLDEDEQEGRGRFRERKRL